MSRKVNMEARERQCAKWNARNPVGSEAWVRLDDGRRVEATTTSAAWALDDGTLVVKTSETGESGHQLSRVEVRPPCVVSFGRGRSIKLSQREANRLIKALAGRGDGA